MNFLAHTYLSFTDEQIVGNLIGDFIKNKKRDHLSEGIQQGITLHRAIDAFTDVHPKVLEAKTVFQPIVRLYSGAFVDVVFDYFNSAFSSDFAFNSASGSALCCSA